MSGGSCGFVTEVTAESHDGRHVTFAVDSPCEHVLALAAGLDEHGALDVFEEMDRRRESRLSALIRESMSGSDLWCPVPFGLHKAMQIACGLSVPEEIAVELSGSDSSGS